MAIVNCGKGLRHLVLDSAAKTTAAKSAGSRFAKTWALVNWQCAVNPGPAGIDVALLKIVSNDVPGRLRTDKQMPATAQPGAFAHTTQWYENPTISWLGTWKGGATGFAKATKQTR